MPVEGFDLISSDTVRWVSGCTLEAGSHDVVHQLFRCVSWALYGLLYSNIEDDGGKDGGYVSYFPTLPPWFGKGLLPLSTVINSTIIYGFFRTSFPPYPPLPPCICPIIENGFVVSSKKRTRLGLFTGRVDIPQCALQADLSFT